MIFELSIDRRAISQSWLLQHRVSTRALKELESFMRPLAMRNSGPMSVRIGQHAKL